MLFQCLPPIKGRTKIKTGPVVSVYAESFFIRRKYIGLFQKEPFYYLYADMKIKYYKGDEIIQV